MRRKRDTFDLPVRYGNVRHQCSLFVGTGVGFVSRPAVLPSVFFCGVGREDKEKRHRSSTMNKQNTPPPPSVMWLVVGLLGAGACSGRFYLLSGVVFRLVKRSGRTFHVRFFSFFFLLSFCQELTSLVKCVWCACVLCLFVVVVLYLCICIAAIPTAVHIGESVSLLE